MLAPAHTVLFLSPSPAMQQLFDMLDSQLDQGTVQRIASQLGSDPQTVARAIGVALPALTAGLARNAGRPDGAQSLLDALRQDHARPADVPLNDPSRLLDGAGILQHVLGGKQQGVVQGVSQASGLKVSKVLPLLILLAPVILGLLERKRQQEGVDSPSGLGGLLGSLLAGVPGAGPGAAPQTAPAQPPASRGGLGGILDADNDGQVADDVARLGAMVLGSGALRGVLGSVLGGAR